jgi:hypothetical protein
MNNLAYHVRETITEVSLVQSRLLQSWLFHADAHIAGAVFAGIKDSAVVELARWFASSPGDFDWWASASSYMLLALHQIGHDKGVKANWYWQCWQSLQQVDCGRETIASKGANFAADITTMQVLVAYKLVFMSGSAWGEQMTNFLLGLARDKVQFARLDKQPQARVSWFAGCNLVSLMVLHMLQLI